MSTSQTKRHKSRVGVVVSDRMMKTVVVAVAWKQPHPLYRKPMSRVTKFKAHDAEQACRRGDVVRIRECRPLSKTKQWRVEEILKRAEQFELRPEEVDTSLHEATAPNQATPPAAQATQGAEPEGATQALETSGEETAPAPQQGATQEEDR